MFVSKHEFTTFHLPNALIILNFLLQNEIRLMHGKDNDSTIYEMCAIEEVKDKNHTPF